MAEYAVLTARWVSGSIAAVGDQLAGRVPMPAQVGVAALVVITLWLLFGQRRRRW